MVTVSNFLVRPFVGRITQPAPYPFVHSEIEVAEILEVPLDHLRDEANLVAEPRIYQGRQIIAYSFHWRDHVIWGATARILKQFRTCSGAGPGLLFAVCCLLLCCLLSLYQPPYNLQPATHNP
jgi:hypothetical protein